MSLTQSRGFFKELHSDSQSDILKKTTHCFSQEHLELLVQMGDVLHSHPLDSYTAVLIICYCLFYLETLLGRFGSSEPEKLSFKYYFWWQTFNSEVFLSKMWRTKQLIKLGTNVLGQKHSWL